MEFTSVWDDAGDSAETEATMRALATAKAASADIWPFLAMAQDVAEFGQRLDLAGDTLTAAASAHGVPVIDLVTAYTREFALLAEARKTAAHGAEHLQEHQFGGADSDSDSDSDSDCDCKDGDCNCGDDDSDDSDGDDDSDDDSDSDSDSDDDSDGDDDDDSGSDSDSGNPFAKKESSRHTAASEGYGDGNGQEGKSWQQEQGITRVGPNGKVVSDGGAEDQSQETDARTPDQKYRDAGNYYREDSPGDVTSKNFNMFSSLKVALEEGQDPLEWIEQETEAGQGTPEVKVKDGLDLPLAVGSRHPFSNKQAGWFGKESESAPAADPLAGRETCPNGHRETKSFGQDIGPQQGQHKCFTCDSVFTPGKTAASRHPFS